MKRALQGASDGVRALGGSRADAPPTPSGPCGRITPAIQEDGVERDDDDATTRTDAEPQAAAEREGRSETADVELFPRDENAQYQGRWEEIQTGFVDDPRQTVEQADELVAQVMQRLAEGFAAERERLEQQWRTCARAAALPQLLPALAGGVGGTRPEGGLRARVAIIARVTTRAILFDLDETLIPEDDPLERAYLAVVRELPRPVEVAELRSELRALWAREAPAPDYRASVNVSASDGLIATFAGAGAERAAIRDFLPRFQAAAFGGTDGLLQRWRRARWENQTVYPGAHEVLRALRGRFRLGLVTNGASDLQRTKLARTGLEDHFDAVVVSSDIGVGKPDPAVFLAALDALGVTPDQAVMIGNDRERDVAGAEAAGVRALWVRHGLPGDGALSDLRELPALL